VLNEIVARLHFKGGLVKHPFGDECPSRAVITNGSERNSSGCCADFMIHQNGEGAIAIVERVEAVGNARHPVAAHAVAHGQQ
jgi:hypothetical protein